MRFLILVILSAVLIGCVGADGKVYRPLIVESNAERQSFVPNDHMIVPNSYEEEQYKNGAREACYYANLRILKSRGITGTTLHNLVLQACEGFPERVWAAHVRVNQEEEEEKTTDEIFAEAGIPLEKF